MTLLYCMQVCYRASEFVTIIYETMCFKLRYCSTCNNVTVHQITFLSYTRTLQSIRLRYCSICNNVQASDFVIVVHAKFYSGSDYVTVIYALVF